MVVPSNSMQPPPPVPTANNRHENQQQQPILAEHIALTKLTPAMRQALVKLQQQCLTCPLCRGVFVEPVTTVACAHTFCANCIDTYGEDNWQCPLPSCRMPLAMKKNNAKFRTINSSTQSVVNSFSIICETLAQTAPDEWWKAGGEGSEDDDDNSSMSDGDDSGRIA